jgi:hypothetical protein
MHCSLFNNNNNLKDDLHALCRAPKFKNETGAIHLVVPSSSFVKPNPVEKSQLFHCTTFVICCLISLCVTEFLMHSGFGSIHYVPHNEVFHAYLVAKDNIFS